MVSSKEEVISYQNLLACVRIRQGKVSGSGTIVYSTPTLMGEFSTYVLTNNHVIDEAIKHEQRWNNVLKRDVKTEVLSTVTTHVFRYKWEQRAESVMSVEADIVAYDKIEDLALLHLRTIESAPANVEMYPKGAESKLKVGQQVVAVGAALGEPPIITVGYLSLFGQEVEGREFWLQTAPTIFGNSGGAVFLAKTGQFIGVPALIATSGSGFIADTITHMSYMIPITRVHRFLDTQLFRFIYDSAHTEESERKLREQRQKQDEVRLAVKEVIGEAEQQDSSN